MKRRKNMKNQGINSSRNKAKLNLRKQAELIFASSTRFNLCSNGMQGGSSKFLSLKSINPGNED